MTWCCTSVQVSSVHSLSCVWLFEIPWITACQASLPITNSWSSLKLMSIESVMPFSHLILCHPLLLVPPIPPSIQWVPMSQLFTRGGQSIGVSASALAHSSEYPRLISSSDWFDLLNVQGTLKSLLQYHSLKASILWYSAFFMVQLNIQTWLPEKP